ncbi:MAG: dienelactone hydrolase family protein [Rhizobiaceae bacterium]
MSDAFQEVELDSRNPIVFKDLLKNNVPRIRTLAKLFLPPKSHGRGPFPAMVMSHGLGGLMKNREYTYGAWLAGQGYAVLLVDSYARRGMSRRRDLTRALRVTESMFLADAFAGLDFLSTHDRVDARRIGIMGFSYGGMVSVLACYDQVREVCARVGQAFAAHISFYGCSVPRLERKKTTGAPVLIVNGALDRNVSSERTRQIVADLTAGGSSVDLHTIDGAYHQWDGDDHSPSRETPALHNLGVTLDAQHRVRCERWGMEMKGYVSRAAVIFGSMDMVGYHSLRDDKTRRTTDGMVHAFAEKYLGRPQFELRAAAAG